MKLFSEKKGEQKQNITQATKEKSEARHTEQYKERKEHHKEHPAQKPVKQHSIHKGRKKEKKERKKNKRKIPLGVNILALIYMISVVFSLILAGILFFNASLLEALPGFTTNVGSATIYAIAIFLIFFSGLSFYIAKGLRKGDKNVRIVLLILLAINAVGGITSVVSSQNTLSWINIGLNGIAILYLLLSKKAKRHFT